MIKNVIFDLSEVLIPGLIGVEKELEKFTATPSGLISKALGSYPYYEIDNNLEQLLKGMITYSEYRSDVMNTLGLADKYAQIFDIQCFNMFDKPYLYTQQMVEKIAQTCDVYLLSDHCQVWADHIQIQHEFFQYFKAIVWSYEVGATKKTKEPFSALIERYTLTPSDCLFIDDNPINICVAKSMGFNTLHFLGEISLPQIYSAIAQD